MQFGVQEAFLVATILLVIVILIIAISKLRSRKYTTIRSNANPLKETPVEEIPDESGRELGGAARVVGYRDLEDIDTINKRLREEVERSRPTLKSLARLQEQKGVSEDHGEESDYEEQSEEDIPVLLDPASEVQPPPQPAQDGLFEEEEPESSPEPEPEPEEQQEEESQPSEVLILNVMTSEEQPFQGTPLKELLFDAGLTFSETNFFQSISDEDGETQFIIANVFNPGTFDVDQMDSFSTIGLCFFQPLQETHDNEKAFNLLLQVAGSVVSELGGQLCDENRSTLTNQTVEHYLTRIREFDMRVKSADS